MKNDTEMERGCHDMITKEDQLKNKANFIDQHDRLYLVRCMNCPDAGDRGRENYAMAVYHGECAWCGWNEQNKEL
jgi:hypothetical protein